MSASIHSFYAFKICQPIGEFYSAVLPACIVRRSCEAHSRRVIDPIEEKSDGIQRVLNHARIKEITSYISTADASFPTSILLSLRSDRVLKSDRSGVISDNLFEFDISLSMDTFSVIDGQHRLFSFDGASCKDFDLPVTFFIDLSEEDKAYLFSTINSTQTKVNKSLVYDLFDLTEERSPQRTAHLIAKSLNSDENGPFYRRIKLLGSNPTFDGEVLYKAILSQGTVVQRLLGLITSSAAVDRDQLKRGKQPSLDGNEIENGLIFRRFFVENRDELILRIVSNYFSSVSKVFCEEWDNPSSPLSRTIGFGALLRLLVPVFQIGFRGSDLSADFFVNELDRVKRGMNNAGKVFNFENYPAAGNGENKLFNDMRAFIG